MGTTPAYALRYADSTSNVQLWTHFQNLATDVDTVLTTKYGIIARWTRVSARVAGAATEVPVIRIDNIAMLAGVYYTIETNSLDTGITAGETGVVYARLSTAGAATTASAQLGYVQMNTGTPGTRTGPVLVAEYAPSGNVTASVLLSAKGGAANSVTLSASASQPIVLMIKAWGKAPTPSGVDL